MSGGESPSPTSPSISATSTSPKIVDLSKLEEVKTVVLNDDALLTLKNVAKNATTSQPSKENDNALNQETAIQDKKVRFSNISHKQRHVSPEPFTNVAQMTLAKLQRQLFSTSLA